MCLRVDDDDAVCTIDFYDELKGHKAAFKFSGSHRHITA